jgi:transposase
LAKRELGDWIFHSIQVNGKQMSDFEAVTNAVTMPWSNGQVKGEINKLKAIK